MFDKEHGDCVIGVDEAGRGPLAGAVVASAVYIPKYIEEFSGINDSKKLSEKKREEEKKTAKTFPQGLLRAHSSPELANQSTSRNLKNT